MTFPDYREGNCYQQMLAHALRKEGFETLYPSGYRRILPLARMDCGPASLLHLHWPEAYFDTGRDRFDIVRRLRFGADLKLASRRRPLIYTAHNFLPHDSRDSVITRLNYRTILSTAAGVIAHSAAAAHRLADFCPTVANVTHVIPHGDTALDFPALPHRSEARRALGLTENQPMVLMFGRAEPYKGLEEIVAAWPQIHPDARLWIAGLPVSDSFARSLRALAAANASITFELAWLAASDLATRLAASDVVLFNYRRLLTSGAASLARSLGRRIVLPSRLETVDLMEPSPTVFRFENVRGDLPGVLATAIATPEDPADTTTWRSATSWESVAAKTAAVYRRALG